MKAGFNQKKRAAQLGSPQTVPCRGLFSISSKDGCPGATKVSHAAHDHGLHGHQSTLTIRRNTEGKHFRPSNQPGLQQATPQSITIARLSLKPQREFVKRRETPEGHFLKSDIFPQKARPGGMAQTAQRLPLDLADALACQAKFLPDLLQRIGALFIQTESQAQDPRLARR